MHTIPVRTLQVTCCRVTPASTRTAFVGLLRCNQGIDFLASIVFPDHRLTRQRSVRALRRRIAWFSALLASDSRRPPVPPSGNWHRWLANHRVFIAPGVPRPAWPARRLATINSYYGLFAHADTWRLRKHIYQKELGPSKRFFLPEGPHYRHLRIRNAWLPKR
ncbi:MAG: hypothetical protein Q7K57_45025 [Burkholderiaceae bacterium]|nr:hypothetical protein [Burkholderiaceae bacterium]